MCMMGAVPVPLDVEGVAGEDEAVDILVVAVSVAVADVVVMVQMKRLPLAATMYHSLFCLLSGDRKTALQESHQGLL